MAQYLSGRQQRVKVNDKTSKWSPVTAGVVQGSVLGPTLFLLFIADINNHVNELVELIKYEDDILIYDIFKDISEDRTQKAVNSIATWAKENKMKLNEAKTQHMIISNNKTNEIDLNIYINERPIKQTTQYKYLGINLNNKCNGDNHINILTRKLSSNLYLFKQMKRLGFNMEQIANSYKSLNSA